MTRHSLKVGGGLRASAILVSVTLAACLQDYDQFDFGAGGAPTTSSTDASTGSSSGSFGSTASSSAGSTANSTASSTANSTVSSTASSTATSSSSSGGVVLVDCFGDTCDVSAGEVCCVDNAAMGSCSMGGCASGEYPIECDEQADCPGEVCCVNKNGSAIDDVSCSFDCVGPNEDLICSSTDPCPAMEGMCLPEAELPLGYMNCDTP